MFLARDAVEQRIWVDDYLGIVAAAYTKYLSDEDARQLIAFVEARKDSAKAMIPLSTQRRVDAVGLAMWGDIAANAARLTVKLGWGRA